MFERLTGSLEFQTQALVLRAQRQQILAGNIANADTPGYASRDFDFKAALRQATAATASGPAQALARTAAGHLSPAANSAGELGAGALGYTVATQPSVDQNTVDMDRERANFVDNAVRYEATLRFINGSVRTMLHAIQGQ